MLKTMLIPVDDIERAQKAISHVVRFAMPNTQVHLVGIIDTPEEPFLDAGEWNVAKAGVQTMLNKLGDYLESKGLATTSDILENPTPDVLIRYIKNSQSDLMILGADSEGNAPLMQTLLKISYVPILLARDQPEAMQYRKILVPLDESPRAECVLPLVKALAQSTQARLVLAHVIQKPEMPRRNFISNEDVKLWQRLVETNHTVAEYYLGQLAERQGVETETRIVVHESVTVALHNLIESENIDLVVLSAHGYSADSRFSLGAIANKLINLCAVSMIVMQDMPTPIAASGNRAVLCR